MNPKYYQVLHNTEVTWFLMAHRFLKANYFAANHFIIIICYAYLTPFDQKMVDCL